MSDNEFTPNSITVPINATVTWTWSGGYSDHNVTFDNTALGGSTSKSTGTYDKVFTAVGTFGYKCTIHGTAMSGKVVVQ